MAPIFIPIFLRIYDLTPKYDALHQKGYDPPSDAPANDGPIHSPLHIRKRRMSFNNFPESRRRRFDIGASLTGFRVFPCKLRVHPQFQQEPIESPKMSITQKDRDILKRLAPDGCNTLTRRPQKRRKKSG